MDVQNNLGEKMAEVQKAVLMIVPSTPRTPSPAESALSASLFGLEDFEGVGILR